MLKTIPAPPRRPPDDVPHRVPVSAGWVHDGTPVLVGVTDPDALETSRRIVRRQLDAVGRAVGGGRRDAEIHRLYAAGGRSITISPVLAELVSAALRAAARTDGDVDPTVAAAVTAHRATGRGGTAGRGRGWLPVCGSGPTGRGRAAAGWETIRLDGQRLSAPPGVTLDLTATARAFAADRAAAVVADRVGCGVLVRLGNDIATAGPAPEGGWPVALPGGGPVTLPAGAALASSRATVPDRSQRNGLLQHVLDPRTGLPPVPLWRLTTVLASSCLEANTCSIAAIVRGTAAPAWLRELWLPARLVDVTGGVTSTGPWPEGSSPGVAVWPR